MGDGAASARTESIAEFEGSLGRFGQAIVDVIRRSETILRRATDQVEDRVEELEHEIAAIEDEIDSGDDEEDLPALRRRLQSAREALARARHCQRDLEVSVERFSRIALQMTVLATETTAEARSHLRGLLSDLAEYFALNPSGSGSAASSGSGYIQSEVAETQEAEFDPTDFPLPHGFIWIPIGDVATATELVEVQTPESFKKNVSYEEMQDGFEALRRRILPSLAKPGDLPTGETFATLDAAAGVEYGKGLQRVYDAFFGSDPIHVSRGPGEQLFSVSSGRHRIKVAMDAGWKAVPGTASDLNPR